MAMDAVMACGSAFEASSANTFFVVLSLFFASFIFADTVVAAAVIRTSV
jgi:hypothetical protein